MTQSWKDTIDARKIALDALVSAGVVDQPISPSMNIDHQKIVIIVGRAINAAIAAAVQAEREACAKIADGWDMPCEPRNDSEQTAHYIARAIRARTEQAK